MVAGSTYQKRPRKIVVHGGVDDYAHMRLGKCISNRSRMGGNQAGRAVSPNISLIIVTIDNSSNESYTEVQARGCCSLGIKYKVMFVAF